jgi:transposase-like protein
MKTESAAPAKKSVGPAKKAVVKKRLRAARKRGGTVRKPKTSPRAAEKKRVAKKAARRRYTPAERANILAAAKKEGLSGPVAANKFGISQLTFYNWRKKAGTRTQGRQMQRRTPAVRDSGNLTDQLRDVARARVEELLPAIITEVLDATLGTRRSR